VNIAILNPNMIFDVMTRAWHSPEQLGFELAEGMRQAGQRAGGFDASIGGHARAMEQIGCVLVHGFRSHALSASVPNEFIAEVVARQPNRSVGVAGIDPVSPSCNDDLDRARALGLSAVTISPTAQGFHPTHSAAMRFYERCSALGLPVFVSRPGMRTPSMIFEYERPIAWDEVARTFPALKVVLSGLGHPWVDETIALLGKHPGIYAETSGLVSHSWRLYTALLQAFEAGVIDKIFFGSGFPLQFPSTAVEAIYSLNSYSLGTPLPSIPRAALRAVVERNPVTTLGIRAPLAIGAGTATPPDSSVRSALGSAL
jgi:predicted TIM-barrel fold metal-dependent hydrolase